MLGSFLAEAKATIRRAGAVDRQPQPSPSNVFPDEKSHQHDQQEGQHVTHDSVSPAERLGNQSVGDATGDAVGDGTSDDSLSRKSYSIPRSLSKFTASGAASAVKEVSLHVFPALYTGCCSLLLYV